VREKLVEVLRLVRAVLHEARIEPHHQHVILGFLRELDSIAQAVLKATEHEEGRREEHQGHRDLSHHQCIPAPETLVPAPGHIDVGGLETLQQVGPRALERGRQAAEKRGEHRQDEARHEHSRVHLERDLHGELRRNRESLHRGDAGVPDGDAAQAPQNREDQALGQEQPDQAETPGADREAHGDLARAGAGPGEEQARGVGARRRAAPRARAR
jgi:hypothetical protein